jgi:hypothetical protein
MNLDSAAVKIAKGFADNMTGEWEQRFRCPSGPDEIAYVEHCTSEKSSTEPNTGS